MKIKHKLEITTIGLSLIIFGMWRLDKIKHFAGRLGTGDFTVLSGLKSTDELGLIGKDLDEMTASLKGMFSAIRENVKKLNNSSHNLSEISKHLKYRKYRSPYIPRCINVLARARLLTRSIHCD